MTTEFVIEYDNWALVGDNVVIARGRIPERFLDTRQPNPYPDEARAELERLAREAAADAPDPMNTTIE